MPDEVLTMETCAACDADVREGTQFCYNCGKSILLPEIVAEPVDDGAKEVEVENNADTEDLDNADKAARRASAALERKRSRGSSKRQTKIVWEAPGPSADRIYLLVCILLFVIAVAVVALTTFLK